MVNISPIMILLKYLLFLPFLFLTFHATVAGRPLMRTQANTFQSGFAPPPSLSQTSQASYFKNFSATDQEKSTTVVAKTNYYKKAQKYFIERERPLHHFLDFGIGLTLIESFYPFETTAYPFTAYLNYRREKWGSTKIPIIFSFHYESLFKQNYNSRIHTLAGIRYPTSHDLRLFHVEFLAGVSVPLNFSFKMEKWALEARLLFTHIIGPKAGHHRLYFQWGAKARLKQQFRSGLIVQLGLDNHL